VQRGARRRAHAPGQHTNSSGGGRAADTASTCHRTNSSSSTLVLTPLATLHTRRDTAGQERYHSLAPMYYRCVRPHSAALCALLRAGALVAVGTGALPTGRCWARCTRPSQHARTCRHPHVPRLFWALRCWPCLLHARHTTQGCCCRHHRVRHHQHRLIQPRQGVGAGAAAPGRTQHDHGTSRCVSCDAGQGAWCSALVQLLMSRVSKADTDAVLPRPLPGVAAGACSLVGVCHAAASNAAD
jgi:hypothetical protein